MRPVFLCSEVKISGKGVKISCGKVKISIFLHAWNSMDFQHMIIELFLCIKQ